MTRPIFNPDHSPKPVTLGATPLNPKNVFAYLEANQGQT